MRHLILNLFSLVSSYVIISPVKTEKIREIMGKECERVVMWNLVDRRPPVAETKTYNCMAPGQLVQVHQVTIVRCVETDRPGAVFVNIYTGLHVR